MLQIKEVSGLEIRAFWALALIHAPDPRTAYPCRVAARADGTKGFIWHCPDESPHAALVMIDQALEPVVRDVANTRAGTSLPVDKGAYGPILFRASACGRKPFGRYFSEPDMVGRDGHAAHHRRLQLAVLNSSRRRPDCVAGVVGLELGNVVAKYPFERPHKFPGIQPNSGHRDYSRLSCRAGEMQLGPSARISTGL